MYNIYTKRHVRSALI